MAVSLGRRVTSDDTPVAGIVKHHSKDVGNCIPLRIPRDTGALNHADLTRAAIYAFIHANKPLAITCHSGDELSPCIRITACSVPRGNAGPYAGLVENIANLFFPAAAMEAIAEETGLPFSGAWRLTLKLYPTIGDLRKAKIDTYTISTAASEIRAAIVVPLGMRNERFQCYSAGQVMSAAKAVVGDNYTVIPPSLMKSCNVVCTTAGGRATEGLDHPAEGHLAVLMFQMISSQAIPDASALYGAIVKPKAVPVATAVAIDSLVPTKGSGAPEMVPGWNEGGTALVWKRAPKAELAVSAGAASALWDLGTDGDGQAAEVDRPGRPAATWAVCEQGGVVDVARSGRVPAPTTWDISRQDDATWRAPRNQGPAPAWTIQPDQTERAPEAKGQEIALAKDKFMLEPSE
jgi:hypothetical protein